MKRTFLRSSLSLALLAAVSVQSAYAYQEPQEIVNDNDVMVTAKPVDKAIITEPDVKNIADADLTEDTETPSIVFTAENWCDEKAPYDFFFVNDDFAGFHLKKGTLTGNVQRFVALMYPESNGFISKVGRHLVAGDMCIVDKNPNKIMQSIIEPYFIGNIPVYFASFKNDFHALFYKDDPEFLRYRIGVRR